MGKYKDELEKKMSEMFCYLVDNEGLTSGDISPADQFTVNECVEKLSLVFERFVEGNKPKVYGIHNPELTTFIAHLLTKEGFIVGDISYRHDVTDSLLIGDYQVFLPNDTVNSPNNEKFSHYYITLANGDDIEDSNPIYIFTELVEVLKIKINKNG